MSAIKPNSNPYAPLTIPPAMQSKLAKIGITQFWDLILHLPLRYEDETHLYPIADCPNGQQLQVEGDIIHQEVQYRPRRQLLCQLQDGTGVLHLRFLNFYPSQLKQLAVGQRIRALGEVRHGFYGAEMVHPKCNSVGIASPLAESLSPIYPATASLSQAHLRRLIGQALLKADLQDTLPAALLERLGLPAFAESIRYLHQPPPDAHKASLSERTHPAWQRLKFDELLAQQLSLRLAHQQRRSQNAPSLRSTGLLVQQLLAKLPFDLTAAQRRVCDEIALDLSQPHPMQRLLQGDVGSGKTIVAAIAALQAIECGYQVALMAPTEILAEQHYRKLATWLQPLGIRVGWLSGSQKKREKQQQLEAITDGSTQLAIGTHALFQTQVQFHTLGLVIVDEQHRFGVHQRLALRSKGQHETSNANSQQPHQLMMSATPIPRTLSMSYYADLDVSVIDELPPGRTPIITKLVQQSRRDEMIERVRSICQTGQQAYWVCPLIEESEKLQLQTAEETLTLLQAALPELQIGLVHGRLSPQEKAQVMEAFLHKHIQVLVATTVIEVGVDVPNACFMLIEHAERMGLSQLHQLRGRVGRGSQQSLCVLMYQTPLSQLAKARLKVIFEHTDGFEISRQDLLIRGPGEFMGARQSGVPMLQFADLEEDHLLLSNARQLADELLQRAPDTAQGHLHRWMAKREELLKV